MNKQSRNFTWTWTDTLFINQEDAETSFELNYHDYVHLGLDKHVPEMFEELAYCYLEKCTSNQGLGYDPEEAMPYDIYNEVLEQIETWCREWYERTKADKQRAQAELENCKKFF